MSCDILALVETRSNNVTINGFELIAQIESSGGRPFGIAVYAKTESVNPLLAIEIKKEVVFDNDSHFEYIVINLGEVSLTTIYISPKFPFRRSLEILSNEISEQQKVNDKNIVIGDFNQCLMSPNGQNLVECMNRYGLSAFPQNGRPTTNSGSQIDYCFSSFSLTDIWVYESLISDHKPLFIIA